MVPEIKEIGSELELVLLSKMEAFQNREVPVLLGRSAESITRGSPERLDPGRRDAVESRVRDRRRRGKAGRI